MITSSACANGSSTERGFSNPREYPDKNVRAPLDSELRVLRDLRGELDFLIARDYRGEQNKLSVTHYPHKSLKNHKSKGERPVAPTLTTQRLARKTLTKKLECESFWTSRCRGAERVKQIVNAIGAHT